MELCFDMLGKLGMLNMLGMLDMLGINMLDMLMDNKLINKLEQHITEHI